MQAQLFWGTCMYFPWSGEVHVCLGRETDRWPVKPLEELLRYVTDSFLEVYLKHSTVNMQFQV